MTRARLRRIRPEKKEKLIATPPLAPGRGEHREQRQSAMLVAVLAKESAILRVRERECSEGPKAITGFQRRGGGRVRHESNVGPRQLRGKEQEGCTVAKLIQ